MNKLCCAGLEQPASPRQKAEQAPTQDLSTEAQDLSGWDTGREPQSALRNGSKKRRPALDALWQGAFGSRKQKQQQAADITVQTPGETPRLM